MYINVMLCLSDGQRNGFTVIVYKQSVKLDIIVWLVCVYERPLLGGGGLFSCIAAEVGGIDTIAKGTYIIFQNIYYF